MQRPQRLATVLLLLACSLPLVGSSVGCSSVQQERTTDRDKVSDLEGNYNVAMEIILYAGLNGWIPDEIMFNVIEPARASANAAIDYLKVEVKAERPIAGSTYLRAAESALNTLAQYQVQYEGRVKADRANPQPKVKKLQAKPTTRPAAKKPAAKKPTLKAPAQPAAPAPDSDVPQPLESHGPGNDHGGDNGDRNPNPNPG